MYVMFYSKVFEVHCGIECKQLTVEYWDIGVMHVFKKPDFSKSVCVLYRLLLMRIWTNINESDARYYASPIRSIKQITNKR